MLVDESYSSEAIRAYKKIALAPEKERIDIWIQTLETNEANEDVQKVLRATLESDIPKEDRLKCFKLLTKNASGKAVTQTNIPTNTAV